MTDPASLRAAAIAGYRPPLLFIDGRWTKGRAKASSPVLDPATGERLATLQHADACDLDTAIEAASRAFAGWRATPAVRRSQILREAAAGLRRRADEWAGLITLELGKPIAQARAEVETACEMIEWAAEEARRLYGRTIPARGPAMRLTAMSDPIGPVGAISGWNAPAVTPARKISGALGAGCTIVLKPSEATPASALMIAREFEAAGLPAGVLNVVFGDPPVIGRRLATDPDIRMVTFTGGTAVGKELAILGGSTLKRMVLELGGHAPVLIFDHGDIGALARAAVAAKFRNGGQICTSPTRFLVHASIYEPFSEAFIAAARGLRVGDPFAGTTQMGPLQNRRRVEAVGSLIADAAAHGAVVARGEAPDGGGFWCPPAVLAGVSLEARANHEEPFGPLALLSRFDAADEAIAEANRLPIGLAAYAFTRDLGLTERLSQEIESGSLAVNHWTASYPETPFGGVKDSGQGAEGGIEGLAAFRQLRFVSVAY